MKPIWRELIIRSEEEWFSYSSKGEYDEFIKEVNSGQCDYKFTYKSLKGLIQKYGKSNEQIKEEVHDFCLDSLVEMMMGPCNKVQLYGYYSAYDHVALCWLFGKMIDLPEGFPMYTIDLKQELDNLAESESKIDGTTFNECLKAIKENPHYPKQENEHSAICDARWNKKLHKFLIN